jgi:hypothetical protein
MSAIALFVLDLFIKYIAIILVLCALGGCLLYLADFLAWCSEKITGFIARSKKNQLPCHSQPKSQQHQRQHV